jgi:homoserine kinase
MSNWRTIRVPASSANLGPGFDALGLALGVYLQCRFRPAARLSIRAAGLDAGLISTGADNLIWQIAQQVGADQPVELEIDNAIPIGKGLGSSAAAVTAGVVIGAEIAGLDWDRTRILDEAARIEGHPDNVAPCILGGLVAAAIDCSGAVRAVRHDLHPDYRVAVVVPDFVLPTEKSRAVLPATYRREDAIFNLQRVALLLSALATGATQVFPAALEDRLHQPYRTPLVPGLGRILALRAPGLLGCALSGAGPSVLVFHENGFERVCDLVKDAFNAEGRQADILHPGVPSAGYELSD